MLGFYGQMLVRKNENELTSTPCQHLVTPQYSLLPLLWFDVGLTWFSCMDNKIH